MTTSNKTAIATTTANEAPVTSKVAMSICEFIAVEPTQLFALFSKLADKKYIVELAAKVNSLEELETEFDKVLKEFNIEFDKAALIAKVEAAGIEFLEAIAVFIGTFAGAARADEFRECCMKAVVTFKMSQGSSEEKFLAAITSIELWGFKGAPHVEAYKAKQQQLTITAEQAANEEGVDLPFSKALDYV